MAVSPSRRQQGERKVPAVHPPSIPELPWADRLPVDSILGAGLQKGPHCLGSLRFSELRRSNENGWVAQEQDLLCLPQDCHAHTQLLGEEAILTFIIYYELPKCQILAQMCDLLVPGCAHMCACVCVCVLYDILHFMHHVELECTGTS